MTRCVLPSYRGACFFAKLIINALQECYRVLLAEQLNYGIGINRLFIMLFTHSKIKMPVINMAKILAVILLTIGIIPISLYITTKHNIVTIRSKRTGIHIISSPPFFKSNFDTTKILEKRLPCGSLNAIELSYSLA